MGINASMNDNLIQSLKDSLVDWVKLSTTVVGGGNNLFQPFLSGFSSDTFSVRPLEEKIKIGTWRFKIFGPFNFYLLYSPYIMFFIFYILKEKNVGGFFECMTELGLTSTELRRNSTNCSKFSAPGISLTASSIKSRNSLLLSLWSWYLYFFLSWA